jgi:hypothetical protein
LKNKRKINFFIFDLNFPIINYFWDNFFSCIETKLNIKKEIFETYFFSTSYLHFLTGKFDFDFFINQVIQKIGIGLEDKYLNNKDYILNCYKNLIKIDQFYLANIINFLRDISKEIKIIFTGDFDNIHKEIIEKKIKEFSNDIELFSSCDFKVLKGESQFLYFLINELNKFNNKLKDKNNKINNKKSSNNEYLSIVFEGNIDTLNYCREYGFISFFIVRNEKILEQLQTVKPLIYKYFKFD